MDPVRAAEDNMLMVHWRRRYPLQRFLPPLPGPDVGSDLVTGFLELAFRSQTLPLGCDGFPLNRNLE